MCDSYYSWNRPPYRWWWCWSNYTVMFIFVYLKALYNTHIFKNKKHRIMYFILLCDSYYSRNRPPYRWWWCWSNYTVMFIFVYLKALYNTHIFKNKKHRIMYFILLCDSYYSRNRPPYRWWWCWSNYKIDYFMLDQPHWVISGRMWDISTGHRMREPAKKKRYKYWYLTVVAHEQNTFWHFKPYIFREVSQQSTTDCRQICLLKGTL